MGNRFASGKYSIAQCDRCGFRYKLKELKFEVIKTKLYQLKVCPECWDPDQPQLQLGMYPVDDPQAVRQPRPDTTLLVWMRWVIRLVDQEISSGDGIQLVVHRTVMLD